MGLGRRLAPVLAAAALSATVAGVTAGPSAAASGASAKAGRLVAFRSCGDLLGYTKAQASRFVSPYGFGTAVPAIARTATPAAPAASAAAGAATDQSKASAPQEGIDYSGTNVQEQGVDEPDIVKTNGKTLFAVANGYVDAVDVTTHQPVVLGSLKLDNGWSHELLLHGDRLLILSRGGYWAEPLPAMAARMILPSPSQSVLTLVDVSNPKAMHVVRTLTLDGSYVAARLVGSVARVVSSSQVPEALPFRQPVAQSGAALADARTYNRSVVASSGVKSWLPFYTLKRAGRVTKEHALVQCRDVSHPASFSGLGMLTVLTVDLDKGLDPVDSVAVMTDARIVYASQGNLYVSTEAWADRPDPSAPTSIQPGVQTTIHQFDISSPTTTTYVGSGTVSGYLLNQWSLSEFQGVLRVVSTETPAWWGPGGDSESFLTTLRPQGASLVQLGRVGELGKGERVYAVRFVGNTGYVVTFRQVDPLYTLDLADPAHPSVLGELTIPGYSAYLHPIGTDLLLGIGQDVDDQGHRLGTQISLFDVSDLKHPTRLQQASLGQGWSEAESDHHAFLFWPRTSLAFVPFQQQGVGFSVSKTAGIREIGRVTHQPGSLGYTPTIRRSMVVGDSVLTVSDAGVESSSLATLADQGWASFPAAPVPTPVPVPVVPNAGTASVGAPTKR
jgi:uncharacterized secreted protein with C-terminal beta-propeller domain